MKFVSKEDHLGGFETVEDKPRQKGKSKSKSKELEKKLQLPKPITQ